MCSIMGYLGDMSEDSFQMGFYKTISRGPDMSKIIKLKNGYLGFHRLAIMELTDLGMQPFELNNDYLVCNGEIYGFRELKKSLIKKGYTFKSDSDCGKIILFTLFIRQYSKIFNVPLILTST